MAIDANLAVAPGTDAAPAAPGAPGDGGDDPGDVTAELVESELLVEEISIDGMCGVY